MSKENTRTLAEWDWDEVLSKMKEEGLTMFSKSNIGHSRTVPFSKLSENSVEGFKRFIEWFVGQYRKRTN
jgi:hypothetical protein